MSWFWALFSFLLLYSIVVSFFCIRFGLIILRVQDSIQKGVEVIDEKYDSISEILSRPLFYDSPEVRKVLKEIEGTRDSLYQIAYDLTEKIAEEKDSEINEG